MAKLRMNQAIARAQSDEMASDEDVILLGEDIAAAGGPFKTSEGLLDRFGPSRVRDTPISEMGFLGAAVGAAAAGLRPVVEMMFIEFLGVAFDQLVTEAAKFRYLSAGQYNVPLVVRASSGAGLGFGCQHSQTLETWMFAAPGLKLAVASGPQSAHGLLRAAIRDDDPVVVLEPRALYGVRGDFDPDAAATPLGRASVLQRGEDVTVVALGSTVRTAVAAASRASWTADVIDLATLIPWDREAVTESVMRTGRLAIVEESPATGGWGTEIAAWIGSIAFGHLKAPILRITTPDVPVPFSEGLERRYLPAPEYVAEQIQALVSTGQLPTPWWEKARSSA